MIAAVETKRPRSDYRKPWPITTIITTILTATVMPGTATRRTISVLRLPSALAQYGVRRREDLFSARRESLALISDAVHNFSDVIALLLAWARPALHAQTADAAAYPAIGEPP
jgi:hypothetical protein